MKWNKFSYKNTFYSLLISILVFHFKYGLDKLIPTNINWLLKVKHDWGQHYLGWAFYRKENWHFPLGKIENLYYPISTNVGYTDSIPLFALPFKLISPILPNEFQYFGFWLFLCFFLTAFLSIKLLKKYNVHWLQLIGIALLITSNPVLLYRGIHPALCSQWLIIASIYLYQKEIHSKNYLKVNLQQFGLLIISSLIHPYISFMILGFSFALIAKHCFFDKILKIKQLVFILFLSVIGLFFIWWTVGYISISNHTNSEIKGGFGLYSMNLNSFYNSFGYSNIIPNQPLINPMQYEGYMYFGVGLILLISFTIALSFKYLKKTINYHNFLPLFILGLFTLLFALTNKITFNEKIVLEFPIPNLIEKFGNIFRASARFFWINYYIILILVFISFSKIKVNKNIKSIFLFTVIIIQFYDISIFFNNYKYKIGSYTPELSIKKWDSLLVNIKHIKTYPPYNFVGLNKPYEYQELAYIAERNNTTFTNFYVARTNSSKEKTYSKSLIKELSVSPIKTNEVIVTSKKYLDLALISLKNYSSTLSYLDGYYILHSNKIKPKIENSKGQKIIDSLYKNLEQKRFKILNSKNVKYTKLQFNVEKLDITSQYIDVSGWGFNENSNNIKNDSIFISLIKKDTIYIAKLNRVIRKDVTSHFNTINLDNTGFKGVNWFNGINKNKYEIGLAIKTTNNSWNIKLLNKSIDKIKIPIDIPETYNYINKKNSNIKFNIETIETNNSYIKISGWSFVKNKNSNNSKIFILLKRGQQILKIPTDTFLRDDVNKYFKSNYNYSFSGFTTKFKNSLPNGKYMVGILIIDSKENKKNITFTDKIIEF